MSAVWIATRRYCEPYECDELTILGVFSTADAAAEETVRDAAERFPGKTVRLVSGDTIEVGAWSWTVARWEVRS